MDQNQTETAETAAETKLFDPATYVVGEVEHRKFFGVVGPVVSVTRVYADGHEQTLTADEIREEERQAVIAAREARQNAEIEVARKQREAEDKALSDTVAEATRSKEHDDLMDAVLRFSPELKNKARSARKQAAGELTRIASQRKQLEVEEEEARLMKAAAELLLK